MSLKPREMGKFANKFCNVVSQLITLQELGFQEDGYHNWNYTIYQSDCGKFSKTLVASSDYLYLRDQMGDKYTDVSLCTLWNRNIAGPIPKRIIEKFIYLIGTGNVKKKESN
jgi:hypothetical protein